MENTRSRRENACEKRTGEIPKTLGQDARTLAISGPGGKSRTLDQNARKLAKLKQGKMLKTLGQDTRTLVDIG